MCCLDFFQRKGRLVQLNQPEMFSSELIGQTERAEITKKGLAFAFLRKDGALLPPGPHDLIYGGHVGWAFQLESGNFYCGSTENSSGQPFVKPGGDNGWWAKEVASEEEMLAAFKAKDYDGYKFATVRNPNPQSARVTADAAKSWGYTALGNNCLDHVWHILAAYGEDGLPLAQTHPAPNDWFAVYNGEYHNL